MAVVVRIQQRRELVERHPHRGVALFAREPHGTRGVDTRDVVEDEVMGGALASAEGGGVRLRREREEAVRAESRPLASEKLC